MVRYEIGQLISTAEGPRCHCPMTAKLLFLHHLAVVLKEPHPNKIVQLGTDASKLVSFDLQDLKEYVSCSFYDYCK